jgi:GAF domain-containing protein/HAMP domain-containing protein
MNNTTNSTSGMSSSAGMGNIRQDRPPRPGSPSGYTSRVTRRQRSLSRNIFIVLGLMILLVLLTSAAGIWYAYQSGQRVQEMRLAATQSVQISELQLKWLAVVGTLEAISVNRPTKGTTAAEIQLDLDSKLGDLENKLKTLGETNLGLSPESIEANRTISQDLLKLGDEMRQLSSEVYDLTVNNRWSQAMTLRQTGLADLQKRLDRDLSKLNGNIRTDLETSAGQVEYLRRLTSGFAGVIALLGLAFAGIVIWAGQRSIIRPMQLLTSQVRQVAQGDFSPVPPLDRQDEIGELSQAISLMTDWLRDSYEMLEQRVNERTQEVERRRNEIQVAALVARDIASTRNLDALMNQAVNLVRERFNFYHAGLFLTDEANEYAVLQAATGEAGRELLARKHRLRIGSSSTTTGSGSVAIGLVGYAAQTGESRIALDVGQDAVHFKNPFLPDTRSEAAIPLKSAGRVIGVLDVQSIHPDAFDKENLQVFQVMADQLATAIQNARLLEEVQQNLKALQTAYGEVDRQAWERFAHSTPLLGYEYDRGQLQPLTRHSEKSDLPFEQPASESEDLAPVQLPLEVRGGQIGYLEVWGKQGNLNEAQKTILANLANRLSQILESARLFEEAQTRASREQMINQLTASLARSLDTEGVLRTAAFQLGNLPAVVEASVFLTPENLRQSSNQGTEIVSPADPGMALAGGSQLPSAETRSEGEDTEESNGRHSTPGTNGGHNGHHT